MPMRFFKSILGATCLFASAAFGQNVNTFPFDGSFDDATFALESAILDQGLVIDYVAHPGAMLARTARDVGADERLFENADVYLFCSAKLSREVMTADPDNVAFCPWSIFVSERNGAVTLGYPKFPEGPMQKVEAFVDGIVQEALYQ